MVIEKQQRSRTVVVMTGSPCAGKSTVLNRLSELGYRTFPEAARILIDRELIRSTGVLPWTNLGRFVELLLDMQLDQMRQAEKLSGLIFFDRSVLDALAFFQLQQLQPPKRLIEACECYRCDFVFDLETIYPLEVSEARPFRREEIEALGQLNRANYTKFGHVLTPLGVCSIDKRVDIILKRIQDGCS
jgi:predicted ATPase